MFPFLLVQAISELVEGFAPAGLAHLAHTAHEALRICPGLPDPFARCIESAGYNLILSFHPDSPFSGRYLRKMLPEGNVLVSKSVSLSLSFKPLNRVLPLPRTRGFTIIRISSIKPCFNKATARSELPNIRLFYSLTKKMQCIP